MLIGDPKGKSALELVLTRRWQRRRRRPGNQDILVAAPYAQHIPLGWLCVLRSLSSTPARCTQIRSSFIMPISLCGVSYGTRQRFCGQRNIAFTLDHYKSRVRYCNQKIATSLVLSVASVTFFMSVFSCLGSSRQVSTFPPFLLIILDLH